ncbi:hypothetical protein ACOMHN_017978 [Nucella lapillus]
MFAESARAALSRPAAVGGPRLIFQHQSQIPDGGSDHPGRQGPGDPGAHPCGVGGSGCQAEGLHGLTPPQQGHQAAAHGHHVAPLFHRTVVVGCVCGGGGDCMRVCEMWGNRVFEYDNCVCGGELCESEKCV